MKRQIIFRGKRLDNGEWVYGDLLHPDTSCRIVNYTDSPDSCEGMTGVEYHYYDVDEATIGQFTGLHDKNGKEIYEGDRLKMKDIDGTIEYYNVVFRKTGFHVDMEQYGHALLWTIDRNRIEVVGNIHD